MRRRIIAAGAALVLLLVGTVVLVAYAKNADRRALAGVQTVSVLVVDRTVAAGTAAGELGTVVTSQLVPAKSAVPGHVEDLATLGDQVATVDLQAGEQLLSSRFADPASLRPGGTVDVPEGRQEVTVALDPERAIGGRLAAGDEVGVLLSMELDVEGKQVGTTHAVLHHVLVTEVAGGTAPAPSTAAGTQAATGDGATGPSGDKVMVTLAVSAPDAETVVFGAEHGTLWLTLEPGAAATGGTRVLTQVNVYGEVTP